LSPFCQLLLTRVRTFVREPSAVFWVYAFPLVMVFSLGTAFRSEQVEQMTVDIQQGENADSVVRSLADSHRFRINVASQEDTSRRLRTGKTELVVRADTDTTARVNYTYDPTRPGSLLARNAVDDVLQRAAGRQDLVMSADTEVSQPGSRYIDFLVPGLIGMGLMGGGMWGVGFATVDLRIRKLLKRFLATPMKRTHFLAAMITSRLAFTIPEVLLIVLFSHWFFGVELQGHWLVLSLVILGGAIQFSGIGLLIASRASTMETVSGLMNAVMMPMWIASGIFFSAERFPDYVQPIVKFLPLTTLIDALRLVMLEGAGLSQVSGSLAIIIGWGVVTFLLALKLFRWQ
jgi:ABC-2 type transport system permease protein